MSQLDREMAKVRAKSDAAMADQAAAGSTRRGVIEAGMRAALDHAVEQIDPALANLEAAIGERLDAGAFLLGVQAAAMALLEVDIIEAVRTMPELFGEYVAKARRR